MTGGSRGIGRAICERLESDGVRVIAPSRDELDLSELDSVRSFCKGHLKGQVDILVNNAGENIIQPILEIDYENWSRIQTINLGAVLILKQAFAPQMIERRWGRILNVASLFSFLSRDGRGAYTASKSGLTGLTRTAAIEWAAHGVLVNALSPGFVNTELTKRNNSPERIVQIAQSIPAQRLCEPGEIAEVATFLVSEKNTYLTGQNIVVDGGFSII